MGMSIEEAIYCMKSYLPNNDYTHCTECKYYGCKDNKTCESSEAHQKAIETMRKYQKIQAIIADWKSDGGAFEMSELYWLGLISEVIEDGKEER